LALLPGLGRALPEDADQPIHIRADRAQVDRNAQTIVYRGSVQVDQGTLQVRADEMIIEYQDQKVVRITALGEPARYQQELEQEQGQVRADARRIVYHIQQEQLRLEGDAFLTQGGNEIFGDLIRYDIVAGRVDAEAGEEGPVRVTVQPAGRSD
jgi:lipopolysaccharide export system protein LptA